MVSSAESFDGERSTRGSPMRWQISDDGKAGGRTFPQDLMVRLPVQRNMLGSSFASSPKPRSIGVGKPQVRKISVSVGEKPIMSTAEFFATLPNYSTLRSEGHHSFERTVAHSSRDGYPFAQRLGTNRCSVPLSRVLRLLQGCKIWTRLSTTGSLSPIMAKFSEFLWLSLSLLYI